MALSGVFSTSVSGGHYRLKAVWSATQNISTNASTVTVKLYLETDYSLNVGGRTATTITINGEVFHISAPSIKTSVASNTLLGTATKVITHDSDGTKSITMSAYYPIAATISGTYYGSITASSGTVALDTIPRASTITSFPNFTIGDGIPIALDRKVSSFTHTLTLKVGSTVVATRTGIGANTTLTLDTAEQDKIYNAIPKDVSTPITLLCDTYGGTTKIGATQSKTATATVGASIVPSFTSLTAEEINADVASIVGKFVQNLSSIKFTINGATGIKGSTIVEYRISFNGVSRDVSTIVFDNINKSGDMVATATITDSRGRTASKTLTINLLPYSMPKITAFALHRCNADGTDNALGTYVKVASAGSVVSLLNGTEKNNLTYKIYSKPRGATTWTEKKSLVVAGLNLNATDTIGTYDATASFDFRLDVTDKFNTTLSLNVLSTGKVTMSWGIEGIGVGKIWERGALDVGGDVYASGDFYTGNEQLLAIKKRLASGDDLNTCIIPGSYRLGGTHTNAPPEYPYGQLLVIYGGGDTIAQILFPYSSGNYYIRSGSPADVGGKGNWNAWRKLWNDGNDGAGSGLDADLFDGHESSDFAKKAQEGWITGVLQSSWTGTLQYTKNDLKQVTIKGTITAGTVTANSAVCTLPVGYRPATAVPLLIMTASSPTIKDGLLLNIAGNVVVGGAGQLANGVTYFINQTFYAEQ